MVNTTRAQMADVGPVTLSARDVQFDWSNTPLHWMRRDPIASHVLNAASLLLPEGERWFCETFREALPLIEDEQLRRSVRGFIGQEAVHAESHEAVLHEVLARNGIDPAPVVRQMEYVCRRALGPRRNASKAVQYYNLLNRLALIAAIENLTALLGDWILNTELEDFDADPVMLDLFRWHGSEEVEHRMVAHDVATYFGVGYVHRVLSLLVAYFGFLGLLTRTATYLAKADPDLPSYGFVTGWVQVLKSMYRGSLPGLGRILWSGVRALDPRFSPEVMGNTAQAVAYLAQSPAARAASR